MKLRTESKERKKKPFLQLNLCFFSYVLTVLGLKFFFLFQVSNLDFFSIIFNFYFKFKFWFSNLQSSQVYTCTFELKTVLQVWPFIHLKLILIWLHTLCPVNNGTKKSSQKFFKKKKEKSNWIGAKNKTSTGFYLVRKQCHSPVRTPWSRLRARASVWRAASSVCLDWTQQPRGHWPGITPKTSTSKIICLWVKWIWFM